MGAVVAVTKLITVLTAITVCEPGRGIPSSAHCYTPLGWHRASLRLAPLGWHLAPLRLAPLRLLHSIAPLVTKLFSVIFLGIDWVCYSIPRSLRK